MNKLIFRYILLSLVIASLLGCNGGISLGSKQPQVGQPEAGKATVTGRVIDLNTNKPLAKVKVWMAEITRQGDQGAYVLDTAFGPANDTDEQGYFVIENIKAMEYVIVVGDPFAKYYVIAGADKKPKAWDAIADQIMDTGDLVVDLTYQ